LVSIPSPHHRRILPIPFDQESSFGDSLKYFFDSIGQELTLAPQKDREIHRDGRALASA
jgi:hypothetical protein